MNTPGKASLPVIKRLPKYYRYLRTLKNDGREALPGVFIGGSPFFLSAALPGRSAQRQGAPAKDLYFLVQ